MLQRSTPPLIKDLATFDIALPPCGRFNLINGTPVYFVKGGAEDVVKIEWVFRAGNSYENKTGIAAAVNRLIKNGTSKKNAFEISKHFEFYGAFFSTACYNEYAMLSLETLVKHLDEVLPVVRELLTDAVFPEKELEIFRQNNIQRMKVNLAKCDFVANRQIDRLLYGVEHPYGRKSEISDMEKVNRDDLIAFYNDHYLEANCKIFASGKLPDDFRETMQEYFGSLNLNADKPFPRIEKKSSEPKMYDVLNDPEGVQAAIRIARPFPDRSHPDFKPAMVLNTILGGYFGSRLMSNIREEKGYTYGIYSYLQNHLQYSAWMITTEAGKDVAAATVEESFLEMKRLCDEEVSSGELALVRNYLIGHQLAALDGPFHIIDRWKSLVLNELDERFFYETIETIKTVTAGELQQLARKYFIPERFYVLSVV